MTGLRGRSQPPGTLHPVPRPTQALPSPSTADGVGDQPFLSPSPPPPPCLLPVKPGEWARPPEEKTPRQQLGYPRNTGAPKCTCSPGAPGPVDAPPPGPQAGPGLVIQPSWPFSVEPGGRGLPHPTQPQLSQPPGTAQPSPAPARTPSGHSAPPPPTHTHRPNAAHCPVPTSHLWSPKLGSSRGLWSSARRPVGRGPWCP